MKPTVSAKGNIMKAAVELFARKGFARTSVREIAEMAGVAKPTLYYYFGSKYGLGLALLKHASAVLLDHVQLETCGETDAVGKIVGFIRGHFRACRENEALARFVYSLSFAPSESPPGYDVMQVREESHEILKRTIDEAIVQGAVRPEWREGAQMAVEGIINIYVMHFLVQRRPLNDAIAEWAVKGLLEGIGNHRKA